MSCGCDSSAQRARTESTKRFWQHCGISSDIGRVEGVRAGLAQHLQIGLMDLRDTRYEAALRWSETGAEEKLADCPVRSCATLLPRLPCDAHSTPKTTFHETKIQEKSKKSDSR